MSSINGIDPIIVDNIKVPTQKPAINETQRSKVSEDKREESRRGKKSRQFTREDLPKLEAAVDKLNQLLAKKELPLYFQINGDWPRMTAQLISAADKKVISRVKPARIFELAADFDTRGFTLDELI